MSETTHEVQQRIRNTPIGCTCTPTERAFLDAIRAKFEYSPGTGTIYGIGVVLYPSDFPGVNLKELVNETKTKTD
jgi:hypothetical protein